MNSDGKFLKPFAGYKDMDACVASVSRRKKPPKDPKAYCAAIMHRVEGKKKKADWDTMTDTIDCELYIMEDILRTVEVTDEVIQKALMLNGEMRRRGIESAYEDEITEEVQFWLDAYPEDTRGFTRVEDNTIVKAPLKNFVSEFTDPEVIWYNFAAREIGSGLQVQLGFSEDHRIVYDRGRVSVSKNYGESYTPYGDELRLTVEKAELIAGKVDDVYYFYDVERIGDEYLHGMNYVERFQKLSEILIPSDHWRTVESYPVSSKASFDSAVEKMLPSHPIVRSDTTGMMFRIGEYEPVILKACPHVNTEPCPIRKAKADPENSEYPIECDAADCYRCPYIKSMFYEESTR